MSTHEVLVDMFNAAVSTIDIAAYYFTLTDGAWNQRCRPHLTCCQLCVGGTLGGGGRAAASAGTDEEGGTPGLDVYNAIVAAAQRGVAVRIAAVSRSIFQITFHHEGMFVVAVVTVVAAPVCTALHRTWLRTAFRKRMCTR